jgi:uncharacterized protein YcbX
MKRRWVYPTRSIHVRTQSQALLKKSGQRRGRRQFMKLSKTLTPFLGQQTTQQLVSVKSKSVMPSY